MCEGPHFGDLECIGMKLYGELLNLLYAASQKNYRCCLFCTGGSSEVCIRLISGPRMTFFKMPVVLPVTRTVSVPVMSCAGV